MELLGFMLLLLLIMLGSVYHIKNENEVFKKARRILVALSILIGLVGVFTPFHFVYGFLISYILLCAVWLLNVRYKKPE